jgi:hypothetical protein
MCKESTARFRGQDGSGTLENTRNDKSLPEPCESILLATIAITKIETELTLASIDKRCFCFGISWTRLRLG